MNYPPPQKKNGKHKENKRNNKTARPNHTFATKKVHEEKHEHKDTTWKNTITKTNCHETSKKPLFSSFFGHPGRVGKFLRIIFWRRTKPKTKNRPKNENPKIGKRYFSRDFLMAPKGRVNKRSGGGRFFDTARSKTKFLDPLFWGSNFKGRVYANDIVLQK